MLDLSVKFDVIIVAIVVVVRLLDEAFVGDASGGASTITTERLAKFVSLWPPPQLLLYPM